MMTIFLLLYLKLYPAMNLLPMFQMKANLYLYGPNLKAQTQHPLLQGQLFSQSSVIEE